MSTIYKSALSWKLFELESGLSMFDRYLNDIHEYAIKEVANLDGQYDKLIAGNENPEYEAHISDHLSEEFHLLSKKYPAIINHTVLVSAYSLFETTTKELHQLVKDYVKAEKPPLEHFQGAKEYIKSMQLITGKDLSGKNKDYNKIMSEYREIRHSIIHHNANIMLENGKLDSPMKNLVKKKHIELNEKSGDFFIKNEKYVKDFIAVIKRYTKTLIDELKTVPKDRLGWQGAEN